VTTPSWQVGIVGCGRIAGLKDRPRTTGPIATHAQAYHRHPDFRLAAVFSQPLEEAHRFGEIWGAPQAFPSLAAMLAAGNLDAVSICSTSECHFHQAREILENPGGVKALLIEKPVCLTAAELQRLMELARQTGVAVAVNHSRRFDAAHRRAAQLLRSGQLGSFLKGRAVYYGGWLNNGVHLIDTIRMLLPEEPEVLAATKAGSGRPGDDDLEVDLGVGGGHIAVEAFDETYYQLFEMELRFQMGRLRLLDFGSQIHVEQVEVNEIGERELKLRPDSSWPGLVSPFYAAVEALDAQLRGQSVFSELGVDLSAVLGTMNLIWQARKMAAG
jgi:predicted dehydrogenase